MAHFELLTTGVRADFAIVLAGDGRGMVCPVGLFGVQPMRAGAGWLRLLRFLAFQRMAQHLQRIAGVNVAFAGGPSTKPIPVAVI
ncbi:hypothetical protein E9531_16960 [Lampropedia puyangensis]|uniref:Uncharacterized protein n=1 Tax=Lampropedia puyangensis TaxID=1330072 RepID=A0A4V4GQ08_9BURK|nr:hypothetical protein [Lampropedia puyangensis]THT95955.1 hypothetical protein E9531_16960 [Lampropedia puyangensis]